METIIHTVLAYNCLDTITTRNPIVARPSLQNQRRTEILDCCEKIVLKEGLAAVNISRLGRELGIDRTTIHHHVGALTDIHAALIQRIVDSFRIEAGVEDDSPPNIDRYIDLLFRTDFTPRHLDQVMDEFEAKAYQQPAIREHVNRFYEMLEAASVDYVVSALPDLPLPAARQLGQNLHALLEGAYLLQNWGRPKTRMKSASDAARLLVKATCEAHGC